MMGSAMAAFFRVKIHLLDLIVNSVTPFGLSFGEAGKRSCLSGYRPAQSMGLICGLLIVVCIASKI